MTTPYNPRAVRLVLIAFERCEEILKALMGEQDLPDSLRAQIADEILARVEHGETDLRAILEAVLRKFRPSAESE